MDVDEKIGNWLHFLDKDRDEILLREEVTMCHQEVLKRDLTTKQVLAIVSYINKNKDNLFSVDVNEWLEMNKLVKLVKEGDRAETNN